MIEWEKYFASAEEIKKHNNEVKKIWDSYYGNKPIRVPTTFIVFECKDLMYRDENESFQKYYKEPEEMLRIQAKVQYLANNIIVNDLVMEEPEKWYPTLDYWPISDEGYWGCEIVYTDRNQPKIKHLYENEKVDPEKIPIPDPLKDNIMGLIYTNYLKMKDLIKKGYKILGKTFSNDIDVMGLYWTYGIFNTATALRGVNIFLDFYEDPVYVKKLLNKVADGYIVRSNVWSKIANREKKRKEGKNTMDAFNCSYIYDRPVIYDHGYDEISIEILEKFLVPVYKKIHDAFSEGWDRTIEFCGRGEQIPIYYHKNFGVQSFNHVNSGWVDIEKLRHELGPNVELHVSIHPEIILNGPPSRIIEAVKEVLTPKIKGKGKLIFTAGSSVLPIENIKVLYEAVKEYGYY